MLVQSGDASIVKDRAYSQRMLAWPKEAVIVKGCQCKDRGWALARGGIGVWRDWVGRDMDRDRERDMELGPRAGRG